MRLDVGNGNRQGSSGLENPEALLKVGLWRMSVLEDMSHYNDIEETIRINDVRQSPLFHFQSQLSRVFHGFCRSLDAICFETPCSVPISPFSVATTNIQQSTPQSLW